MSGPRMGSLGQMNGSRRPNISRMNYHDRQGSYHDRQQSYQDHRQSSHEGRNHDHNRHDSRHDHRSHDARQQENRQQIPHHANAQPPVHSQHDEIIKYIHESWSKIEMDKGSNNVTYYQEPENHHLKDFRPFDLEAFWGRRMHQNHNQPQQQQQHHS